eukprot:c14310_g1_i1.p1 GENE.c14310_g1_i1~~c14310_g1_i1.p1  ORF type:complete len:445 (-),score=87.05 c14310_g1_i1:284-1618(-)
MGVGKFPNMSPSLSAWLIVLIGVVSCIADSDTSYVLLDANNFQLEVDSKDVVLVCFFHSKAEPEDNLSQEFVNAATRLQGKGPVLAAVDCAIEKTLMKKYEIEDFPTLRLFRDGKVYHYRRPIETNAIVDFVEMLLQPAVATVSTVTEAIELTESDKAVVIGFFSPENTKEYETFLNVASTFQASDGQAVLFAEVVNPQVVKEFEIVYTPMVFLFRPNEDAVGYTGMFNERELADWITISTTPTLRELLPETFLSIFEDNTPTLLAFVDKKLPSTGALLTVLTEVSVRYLHKINFVFTERQHFGALAEKMGISGADNAIAILDFSKREHFLLGIKDGATTSKEVNEFCDSYLKGTLVRAEDGAVTAPVTGEIPETVVIANPSNELMMDFYVPWCDFYINIGVPHSGLPRVSLLNSLPSFNHTPTTSSPSSNTVAVTETGQATAK